MVLIFSIQQDHSTNTVIQWLHHLGKDVIRMNGDDDTYIFEKTDEQGIYFYNRFTGETINLLQAEACWWRRIGIRRNHLLPKDSAVNAINANTQIIKQLFKDHINYEIDALNKYICETLYQKIPINLGGPVFDLNRLCVLEQARRLGLKTPKFEIITDGEQLKMSKNTLGKIVTKAISNGLYDIYGNQRYYTYTEVVEEEFYRDNEANTFAPSLITELVEKEYEIRSFYIDGKFFSMAIFSQSSEDSKTDYRISPPGVEVPYKLPLPIEQKLRKLYESLNLNTGSADLIVDKQGEYVFLEINPVGQFGMTSIPCNYNLEKVIAKYLAYGRI